MKRQDTPKSLIFFMMGMMLLTGALNTIIMKSQSGEEALNRKYKHSWVQTVFMFFG
jgi:hypothetical protein